MQADQSMNQSYLFHLLKMSSSEFLTRLFSEKIRGIAIGFRRPCHRRAKTLIFCKICFIPEVSACVHYPKSNPYYQGRQFQTHFFPELWPCFNSDFLSSIKHPAAERLIGSVKDLRTRGHSFDSRFGQYSFRRLINDGP